jgi:hypothetical protein
MDFAIAVVAFTLLTTTRLSVLFVLAGCVLASIADVAWTGAAS